MITRPILLFRILPRVRHVWKTEGFPALLKKIKRRVDTTPLRIPRRPMLLHLKSPFEALSFRFHETPEVSIVIPVFNQYPFTYHCLSALARQEVSIPYEIIVVDDCSTDETAERLTAFENLTLVTNACKEGFVRSCNLGAAHARGEFLVFLNNDTQVQPGWLHPLVETFRMRPDAGMVGSRLIYPDGRLQEAGGIVFADGSAWNYGQLDDPYKPKYSHLRAVDYCSGASLAIRLSLFERLGGFDEHYAPAYYEDVDLAFRVREAHHAVYYQPLSRVVHFEGVSAGTDEATAIGMKRFQAVNRDKFLARWGKQLAQYGERGEDLDRAKERQVERRVFVADNFMITPDRESGSLRMLNFLGILQDLGCKVTFAAVNLEAPEPYVSTLQMRGIECLYRPYVKSLARHLRQQGHLYDLVILSRADAAAALMPAVRRYCQNARIFFDTVDLHFLRETRLAELTGDGSARAAAERRKRQELDLIARADATLVVSTAEMEILKREAPAAKVYLVSNIHRISGSAAPFSARRDILFIGAFAHPPNTDAVLWLAREILPLIRAVLPDLCCHVIGADPPAEIRRLAGPGLTVHGYVRDVAPFFAGCRVSVASLRYGAGVKGKINQSLAHGLPVVATTLAVEGMHLTDGESVLVADDPAAFAAAVIRLYQNSELWNRLSAGGLDVMERYFGFAAGKQAIQAVIHG